MIRLKRILFTTDFSSLSRHALAHALFFARKHRAQLHVLHVVDEAYQYMTPMGPEMGPILPPPDEALKMAKKELGRFVTKYLGRVKLDIASDVSIGRPFLEIIRYAKEKSIDLIVLGTHGHGGLKHVLMGSVAEKVVRKAPCPVLTIRDPKSKFVMP